MSPSGSETTEGNFPGRRVPAGHLTATPHRQQARPRPSPAGHGPRVAHGPAPDDATTRAAPYATRFRGVQHDGERPARSGGPQGGAVARAPAETLVCGNGSTGGRADERTVRARGAAPVARRGHGAGGCGGREPRRTGDSGERGCLPSSRSRLCRLPLALPNRHPGAVPVAGHAGNTAARVRPDESAVRLQAAELDRRCR